MTHEFAFRYPFVVDPLSARGLLVSFCFLIIGLAAVRLQDPKIWTEMWVALHLWLGSYWLLPALVELFQSFFLLIIFGSCSGSWEGNYVLYSLWGQASKGLFSTSRNTYRLSWQKPNDQLESIFAQINSWNLYYASVYLLTACADPGNFMAPACSPSEE